MTNYNYFALPVDSTTCKDSNLRLGIYSVRRKVYVEEMGLDPKLLTDELDQEALHVACIKVTPLNYNEKSNTPKPEGIEVDDVVGTARVISTEYPDLLKVERVSVIKSARKQGLAQRILIELENQALQKYNNLSAFYLSGNLPVENLYKSLGYSTLEGSEHWRHGILHVLMLKTFGDSSSWNDEVNWKKLIKF